MKPTTELILSSLSHLESDLISPTPNLFTAGGKIPNKLKGYIASFGGSIVQLGIMPTCMAYIANTDKEKLVNALFTLYKNNYDRTNTTDLKKFLIENWQTWSDLQKKQFRNRMAAIAVSFKLALRTFEIDESVNS